MSKRIGVDMRMMKPFPTGIGIHFLNLIHNLITQDSSNQYILIINGRGEESVKNFFKDITNIEYKYININGGSFKQYILTPYLIFKYITYRLDLLITDPWSSFPLLPVKYYLMIYDLIGFNNVSHLSLKQTLYDKFVFKFIAHRARAIIASGKSVSDDIEKYFKIKRDKIHIIPPSTSLDYLAPISTEFINETLLKYKLTNRKYFVYIGNRRPHKNIKGAIEAFNELLKTDLYKGISFVLIGGFDSESNKNDTDINALINSEYRSIRDNIKVLGRIESTLEVKAILNASLALFHPTLFEGFGLTPLEAMYSGTPVISSDITAVKEVVGDAGLLNNPLDIKKNVESLKLIIEDDIIRQELIKKGLWRAKGFNWEESGRNLKELVNKI